MNPTVLLVDDEPRVLDAYRRNLRKRFELVTETDPVAALSRLNDVIPAVVVSDFQMPGMDGVQFLSAVKERAPEAVRMMLTGQADMTATMAAVNDGRVFRFLTKPCDPDTLAAAIEAGIEQHRLIVARREILEQTLHGTVRAMAEILGLVDPDAYTYGNRLLRHVTAMSPAAAIDETWEFELAAMVAQLGTIALPTDIVRAYREGRNVESAYEAMIEAHPQTAYGLLAPIPRLGRVARMVLQQETPPPSRPRTPTPDPDDDDEIVAAGAHLLNIAITFERRLSHEARPAAVLSWLRAQPGPPFRLQAIDLLAASLAAKTEDRLARITAEELRAGMITVEPVLTKGGVLLLAADQEVTGALVDRIIAFKATAGIQEPLEVRVPG